MRKVFKKTLLMAAILFGAWILISSFLVLIEPKYYIFKPDKNDNVNKISYDPIIYGIPDYESTDKIIEQFYNQVEERIRNGINIQEIPNSDLNEKKLIEDKYKQVLYDDKGKQLKVIFNKGWINYLQFSPSKNKLGFYYEHYDYPTAGRDVSLVIMDISKQSIKEVYKGSFKTSYWEWDDDENYIIVYYGGCTGCLYAYKINTETGERESEYYASELTRL